MFHTEYPQVYSHWVIVKTTWLLGTFLVNTADVFTFYQCEQTLHYCANMKWDDKPYQNCAHAHQKSYLLTGICLVVYYTELCEWQKRLIGLQRKKVFQKNVCKCVVGIIFIFTPGDGFICMDSGLTRLATCYSNVVWSVTVYVFFLKPYSCYLTWLLTVHREKGIPDSNWHAFGIYFLKNGRRVLLQCQSYNCLLRNVQLHYM